MQRVNQGETVIAGLARSIRVLVDPEQLPELK